MKSLRFFFLDDEYEFTGCHLTGETKTKSFIFLKWNEVFFSVRNGYSILPLALCENQNIRLKRVVKKISYNKSGKRKFHRLFNRILYFLGVEIQVENGEDTKAETPETYRGEAVLVTVPLGVLKEKVVTFDPPLPDEKQSAIDRLGFGNLNKVKIKNFFENIFFSFGLRSLYVLIKFSGIQITRYLHTSMHRHHHVANYFFSGVLINHLFSLHWSLVMPQMLLNVQRTTLSSVEHWWFYEIFSVQWRFHQ